MIWKKVAAENHEGTFTLGAEGAPVSVEGVYGGFDEVEGKFGMTRKHKFETEGGPIFIWGKAILNGELEKANLVGRPVRVTFLGMKQPKTKGARPAYNYMVEVGESAAAAAKEPQEPKASSALFKLAGALKK